VGEAPLLFRARNLVHYNLRVSGNLASTGLDDAGGPCFFLKTYHGLAAIASVGALFVAKFILEGPNVDKTRVPTG
jgi:hypothetical protein